MLLQNTFCKAVLMVMIVTESLFAQSKSGNINVQYQIVDSLSRAAIPCVRVRINNLNKSFTTLKSAFYPLLPPGDYTIILETQDYETLKNRLLSQQQATALSLTWSNLLIVIC